MDPIAHTLTGAALSGAGLRRRTPLATATLVIAANAPDVDVLVYTVADGYAGLAFRRGITHGLPALVLWPLVIAALVLLWDRAVRRRRRPDEPPARFGALVVLAALGVATHPALDWLNTYGMRWLMPFDDTWFYGDALFIVDPWVWLVLGGACALLWTASLGGVVGWSLLAAGTSALVLTSPIPVLSKAVWVAGVATVVALRALGRPGSTEGRERLARRCVGAVAAYILVMVAADVAAERMVRSELARTGAIGGEIHDVMVAPRPASPFRGEVVVQTAAAYHQGGFGWLERPRLRLSGDSIPRVSAQPEIRDLWPIIEAAAASPRARDFLVWSRYPFYDVRLTGDGYLVRIGDARYPGRTGDLSGLRVRLDRELRPRPD